MRGRHSSLLILCTLLGPGSSRADAVAAQGPCSPDWNSRAPDSLRSTDQEQWRRRRPAHEDNPDETVTCSAGRLPTPNAEMLAAPVPVVDRWRLVEQLGYSIDWRNPYIGGNPLKGDRPYSRGDRFTNLSASFSSLSEARAIATPGAGLPARTATRDEQFFNEALTLDAVLYQGDTVFRPPDWQMRATAVISYSGTHAGTATASGGSAAVQALWFEKHLRDVSAHYDFDAVRAGIQPLTSDFRGFLLSDQPLALRLFGTRDNNMRQYNLAWFRRLQKNRVRLNTLSLPLPAADALLANLYWQDFPRVGLTSEIIGVYSTSRVANSQALRQTDGTVVDAASIPQRFDVGYLGYSLDGHVARLNTTAVLYGVTGHQRSSAFSNAGTQVRAWFAASELSMDFDWRRVRISLLHASGDRDPFDRRASGFDNLNATPVFAGSDSSFFAHQRWSLGSGVFDLKGRDSLLPSLRPANDGGLSNFSNPGLNLLGLGVDLDFSSRLRASLDVNQLWFDQPGALSAVSVRPPSSKRIGTEFAVNSFWRPWNNQNVIVRLSGSTLLRGAGYRELYAGASPYSLFAFLVFTY